MDFLRGFRHGGLLDRAAQGARIADHVRDRRNALSHGKSLRESGDLVGRIISAECYPRLAELVDNAALPLDEAVRVRVRAGASISPNDYAEVLSERERAKRANSPPASKASMRC